MVRFFLACAPASNTRTNFFGQHLMLHAGWLHSLYDVPPSQVSSVQLHFHVMLLHAESATTHQKLRNYPLLAFVAERVQTSSVLAEAQVK